MKNICVWSSIDRRFFQVRKPKQRSHLCFSFDTNFIHQSFSVRSRLSNDRRAARLRGWLTISKCALLLLLFKMNATRDWNRKGSSCGGVLGQLSHEVLVQHCLSSGLRQNDHTSNLFLTIVITLHLFKVMKYHLKARDRRGHRVFYSCYHQTQLKTFQHPSYIISFCCHFGFLFSVLPNFREDILLARTSISALFFKQHRTYLQDNEKIELCGNFQSKYC